MSFWTLVRVASVGSVTVSKRRACDAGIDIYSSGFLGRSVPWDDPRKGCSETVVSCGGGGWTHGAVPSSERSIFFAQ